MRRKSKFPPLYWLVVVFEFFERGSYYGMMSVLSVYLTDVLRFPKEDVGLIKGTIQPLLYFLPIISGALADRFGYRRTLMAAFALLGTGYFLTSQATGYAAVFVALVVMGIGAGTFKPVISGTIARCTDETNATLGFGIFYWSINLGAFLFPLFLVPYLKNNVGWDWVIMASAIGTGILLIPTFLWFKEPPRGEDEKKDRRKLLQTLADAFEIIYSPFVLLVSGARRSGTTAAALLVLLLALLGYGGYSFIQPGEATLTVTRTRVLLADSTALVVAVERNLCKAIPWKVAPAKEGQPARLTVYNPDTVDQWVDDCTVALKKVGKLKGVHPRHTTQWVKSATARTTFIVRLEDREGQTSRLENNGEKGYTLVLSRREAVETDWKAIHDTLTTASPALGAISQEELSQMAGRAGSRPFLLLFVGLLLLTSLFIIPRATRFAQAPPGRKTGWLGITMAVLAAILWSVPDLSLFARIASTVISFTILSLYAIDYRDLARFKDHLRFLLMIFIYSGFWILYFQMFDSVLWYVQSYVDATGLNNMVNSSLAYVGLDIDWRWDVEHVTVINAGTIILLQLVISNMVKNTKALPTMIAGIATATAGMAILAISADIWVFLAGITLFSIGEMTAHPKFIAYVSQTAPRARVAMYMGYLFLYGVIGASIGGVLGATLYVKFVDEMNQPRTLWLIFTGIGVATIVGLLLYNRFFAEKGARG